MSEYHGQYQPPECCGAAAVPPWHRRLRAARWFNPLQRQQLPELLQSRLRRERTIAELTSELSELRQLLEPPQGSTAERVVPPRRDGAPLPDATPQLADRLCFPLGWLDDAIGALRQYRQVILYGPPGTGKTRVAKELAEHVAAENVRLVQFHAAYTYEDFFEGYRPRPIPGTDGQVGIQLDDGPFKRLADEARKNPGIPFVMLIDEINRAHPAKVLGELYFLLEYRGEAIRLLYSPEGAEFSIPENLYLIGTMNTADRSIALMDAAMRRRFAFLELHPLDEPIHGLLRKVLAKRGRPSRPADFLDELNRRILQYGDRDATIGPAYFLGESLFETEDTVIGELAQIWGRMLMPLLEETFYGQNLDVGAVFGFEAIARAVRRQRPPDAEPGPPP
jgi:5-methylcytosine-specific restriction enzyme B